MCGCYELKTKARDLNRLFPQLFLGQSEMPHAVDMHPIDSVLMITRHNNGHLGIKARWGLVGSFLDKEPRNPLINLPSKGLVNEPFYNKILRKNRCLIPATSFYEWPSHVGKRQKMRISHPDGKAMMFAGIFDHHPLAGTTCALLTTAANETLSHVHHRMPLILDREESSFWLAEHAEFPDDEFEAMLQTPSRQELTIAPVIEEEPSPQLTLAFA